MEKTDIETHTMQKIAQYQEFIAFLLGVSLMLLGYFLYVQFIQPLYSFYIGQPSVTQEVHVHSDFLINIQGETIDLSDDTYQSSAEQILLEDFHLHDNVGTVIHRHAAGLTLASFLKSLGFELTNECLTLDSGETYCSNQEHKLLLYVNGLIEQSPTTYIPQEGDRILLYYGDAGNRDIQSYLNAVTDEACIYSGTCPERGTPPPESCGITCEL